MAAGWAGGTLGGHTGADLSPFTHLSLPQGPQPTRDQDQVLLESGGGHSP